jgi:CRP-like cAMP-binding protein
MLIENSTISDHFFGNAFLADDLLVSLSPAAEENLRAVTHRQEFGANETVFARGQTACCVYFLRRGTAQIVYHDEQPVRLIAANEILGLTEALSNLPYEIAVHTVTPCSFDRITRADFLDFLQREPEICFRLLQILGTNLQKLFRLLH